MRQLAAWEEKKAELEGMEATIYAVSVDNLEKATEVSGKELTFPVAYGATKEDGEKIGAWWSEDRDGYIQPSEFLLRPRRSSAGGHVRLGSRGTHGRR